MMKSGFLATLRISFLYILFGGVWIVLSDRILLLFFTDPREITLFQTYKGWAFVMASTFLLYFSVRRELIARERAEEKVVQERDKAQKYLDVAGVLFAVVDADQRISLINRKGCDILGYQENELIGRNWFDTVIPERNRGSEKAGFERIMAGAIKPVEYTESSLITGKGEEKIVAWHNIVLKDEEETILGMLLSGEDITEQKRAERKIQSHIQRLAALRTIDMAISASMDLRVTLNVFLDQVVTQLGVDAADLLLLNQYQQLEYAAGRGFRYDDIARSHLHMGEGMAGKAALERRTIIIPHLQEAAPRFTRLAAITREGFIAYCGVPLIAKGQVKGVLELFNRTPLDQSPEWLEFLDSLATQAAIAIDAAELYENLQQAITDLNLAYDATLEGWGRALELRDEVTEGHTERVTEMTLRLVKEMGMREQDLIHVRRGAFLHDIGKIGIPDSILRKPGPLTEEEWQIMRQHPVYAYELLIPIRYLRPAIDIPYCHHEKWDGTGYPRGLKGEKIPLAARAFAVVDIWDALRSNRPYHTEWTAEETRSYIRSLAGSHLDPAVVEVFLGMQWD